MMSIWKAEHSQNRPDMSLITRAMRDKIVAKDRILREEVERITGQYCRLWNAAMKKIVAEYGKTSQREVYAEGARTALRSASLDRARGPRRFESLNIAFEIDDALLIAR
jgi:hypothetical protein